MTQVGQDSKTPTGDEEGTVVASSSGHGRQNFRQREVESLIRELGQRPTEIDEGDFTSLSAFVSDAIEEADAASLSEAAHGLRWLAQRFDEPARLQPVLGEARGRVLGLLTVAAGAGERLTSRLSSPSFSKPEHAYRFLAALIQPSLRTSKALQEHLNVDETQVSRLGRRLLEQGLVRRFKIGRTVHWEPTSRGRQALASSDMVARVPDILDNPNIPDVLSDRVSVSFDPGVLASLLREADILNGYQEAAARHRQRLVSPEASVFNRLLRDLTGPLSAEELSEQTSLSPPTVLRVLDSLLARGVIETVGAVSKSPWSVKVRVRHLGHCVVGVHVMEGQLVGVVTDLRAYILDQATRPVESTDPDYLTRGITSLVADLTANLRLQASPPNILGVGVELGGHVDSRTGVVYWSPNLTWELPVRIGPALQSAIGLPTVVENDANALTVYEQLYGDAARSSTFAVVMLGQGIGGGIVVDHQLVRGSSGSAGELGHLPVGRPGDLCSCGHLGCLQATASISAITRRVSELAGYEVHDLDAAHRLAQADNRFMSAFLEAGTALGQGIVMMLNLIAPELVLIEVPASLDRSFRPSWMGGIGDARNTPAEVFYEALLAAARERSFSHTFERCRIEVKHVPDALLNGASGAAAAVLGRFVQDPLNESWYPANGRAERESDFLRTGERIAELISSLAGHELDISPTKLAGDNPLMALRESVRKSLGVPPAPVSGVYTTSDAAPIRSVSTTR